MTNDKKTIIFDLDGTLALIDKRRAISTKPNGKLDWDIFFDPNNISLDEPNTPVIKTAQLFQQKFHLLKKLHLKTSAIDQQQLLKD